MSRNFGRELPPELLDRLAGAQIEAHEGKIIPVCSIDEAGWPHPALLSYYEIVAKDPHTLDTAVWKDSSTAKNLRRAGKITLLVSDHRVNFYLKGAVRELEYQMTGAAAVSRFRISLEEVIEDQEANAEITSGLTYKRLTRRDPNDFASKVFRLLRDTA